MPRPLLSVIVEDLTCDPTLTGLCAGFESGEWRAAELARHLIQWVPEWALTHSQLSGWDSGTGVELLTRALQNVYRTHRYTSRGEVGELLLHIALRQVFNTERAISKIAFKDSPNDVVKGFDCVHVVDSDSGLELWLGEAKLYADLHEAIRSALTSLDEHLRRDYLRAEFAAVIDKIEPSWPLAETLTALLRPETSLDAVFARLVIPIFIGYDSEAAASHQRGDEQYLRDASRELQAGLRRLEEGLTRRPVPGDVRVRAILLPMGSKAALLSEWDARLKAWQDTL